MCCKPEIRAEGHRDQATAVCNAGDWLPVGLGAPSVVIPPWAMFMVMACSVMATMITKDLHMSVNLKY